MRFLIMVKATKDSEAGVMPEEKLIGQMAQYHEELAKAGMLLDGSGLHPTSKGWRIKYSGGKRALTDGPFAEAKDFLAGYWIVDCDSVDRVYEIAGRASSAPGPDGKPMGIPIEVRQVMSAPKTEM